MEDRRVRIDGFEREVIRAVELQTEYLSVMKLLWNMSGLNECEPLPELSQREMQSLGLDYDSRLSKLLAMYKHVTEPKVVFTQESNVGVSACDTDWPIPIKEL
jgi:hypothetical protein